MLASLIPFPKSWRVLAVILTQVVVGGLFAYAGISKVLDPLRFASSLLGYQIIPVGIVRPIVLLLPWIEITLGVLFLTGRYVQQVAIGLAGLLTVFTGLLIIALLNGWVIDCGCFGAPRPVDLQKILENIAMLGCTVCFARYPTLGIKIESWREAWKDSL